MILDSVTSNPWAIAGLVYGIGFWAVLMWVFRDAHRRSRPHPLVTAFWIAVVFPVGVFLYLKGRDGD